MKINKTTITCLALVVIFFTAASFKSIGESSYKGRSELEQLYQKAKDDHKELAEFEASYLEYQAKLSSERSKIHQKLNAREFLHSQAKSLINSIRNESIKKHAQTIQSSYYAQFQSLRKKHTDATNPISAELSISADWFNAMKVAYVLEQNRLIERQIEEDMKNNTVTIAKVKELNASGKRLLTKMLTPAD